jgi:NADP-dependent 3-hydroxy acid dehydrogenase YdfG
VAAGNIRHLGRKGCLQEVTRKHTFKSHDVETDVTDPDQVQRLVDKVVQTYGRVNVIINNAGLMPHSPLERLKIDDWNRMIDVNIKGVLYGIAAVIPYMKEETLS